MSASDPTRGGEPLLTAHALTVGYDAPVLRDVDLTVRRGECVGLVGANGSGKTTLFRTLLGILPPLGGAVTYGTGMRRAARDGAPSAAAAARPALGYVPQRDTIDATIPLTVFEIVRMGAYRSWTGVLRGGRGAMRRRVAAALATVAAAGWERRLLTELSGGERQRVLIARALMADPELLFLDEPTTGIDVASEAAIYAEVARCRAAGLGVLMVSHDLDGVCRVATRAVVIRDGRLIEIGDAPLAPDRLRTALAGRTAGV